MGDVPTSSTTSESALPEPGVLVTYRLSLVADRRAAADFARAIAREQTVEVPPGVGGEGVEARMLGRVEAVERAPAGGWDVPRACSGRHRRPSPRYDARIAYPVEATGTELTQLLNVVYGNVSFMRGARVVDLTLPAEILSALPGPRFGIDGIRALTGVARRPLLATAIKPMGLSTAELAGIAAAFARGGVDIVKDDHGLADQPAAPFAERVATVAEAVAAANAATDGRTLYLPNVTGPIDTLEARIDRVASLGLSGVLLSPGLTGLDAMRAVAAGSRRLAVMAHPSHGQSAPGRRDGIAPDVLFGLLHRAAGADMVAYPDAGGRFGWPDGAGRAIAARLRSPLGSVRPALPSPAGGVKIETASRSLARYGPDTMLLIGGSLLMRNDIEGAARRLVEAASRFAEEERS